MICVGQVLLSVPKQQLAYGSLSVGVPGKSISKWKTKDHEASFTLLQKVVEVWRETQRASQYLVIGKKEGDKPFTWEAVPYYTPGNPISRFWQQFVVLWRITFGGCHFDEKVQVKEYTSHFISSETRAKRVQEVAERNDAFCKNEVIQSQLIFEGRKVNVLFNYAPIGFGGEKLHFLVVPKEHKEAFTDLAEDEYVEAMELSQKLMGHYGDRDAYLFHKTGRDAGQTIPHWHLHLIFTATKTEDFFGKLTVLRNMLFGSSPMKPRELAARVKALRSDLKFTSE